MSDTKEFILLATDRCDAKACGAQAYIKVSGITGELFFCGHHYNKSSGSKLEAFAFETIDERERLIQNKSQGDDY